MDGRRRRPAHLELRRRFRRHHHLAPSAADFGPAFEAALCTSRVACGFYPNLATCEAILVFAETSDLLTSARDVARGTVRY